MLDYRHSKFTRGPLGTRIYINLYDLVYKFKNKIKLRSFKSSEHINEKRWDGPYCGFGYLSLLVTLRFGKMEPKGITVKKSTSRQRSGKGVIRKRFPLQKPTWEKTKLTIRYLFHENIS